MRCRSRRDLWEQSHSNILKAVFGLLFLSGSGAAVYSQMLECSNADRAACQQVQRACIDKCFRTFAGDATARQRCIQNSNDDDSCSSVWDLCLTAHQCPYGGGPTDRPANSAAGSSHRCFLSYQRWNGTACETVNCQIGEAFSQETQKCEKIRFR